MLNAGAVEAAATVVGSATGTVDLSIAAAVAAASSGDLPIAFEEWPLDVLIKKHILLLNNELPPTVAYIWVTSKELHQRLIHMGVRKSLTLERFSSTK